MLLKEKNGVIAKRIFVVLISIFVFVALIGQAFGPERQTRVSPIIEADRAELYLRFNSALQTLQKGVTDTIDKRANLPGSIWSAHRPPSSRSQDFLLEAKGQLAKTLAKNPDSIAIKIRMAILLASHGSAEEKERARALLQAASASTEPKYAEMSKVLLAIYFPEQSKSAPTSLDLKRDEKKLESTIKKYLPPGWNQDTVLMQLYVVSHDQKSIRDLQASIDNKSSRLLINSMIVIVVALLVTFIGLIVILLQLASLASHSGMAKSKPTQTYGAQKPTDKLPWNFKTTYLVFIFWLATQLIVAYFAQSYLRPINSTSTAALSAPLAAALLMAGTYLCENVPPLFYINWLALRPHKINFADGIKLRLHTESAGLIKLVFAGFLTWSAAMPIVICAFMVAAYFFGSQGSSNPVIALVLEASRTSNILATSLFYVTLGVLAPACEEPLFRGFLYQSMRSRYGILISMIVSALLFAVLHLDPGGMLPLFCLGFVFAYTFERTQSLIPSLVAHGLWNSGTFTLLLLLFSW